MDDNQISEEELSRFGRYLASRRPIVSGQYEICGKPFKGTTKRRYCSNTCAQRAVRQRQREAQGTRTEETQP
jgi:hypothetical protein